MADINRELLRQIKATDKDVELFGLRLEKFLRENLNRLLRGIDSPDESFRRAAERVGGLLSSLQDLGLDSIFDDVASIYGDNLKTLIDIAAVSTGAKINPELIVERSRALVEFDISALKTKTYSSVEDLKAQVMRAVTIGDVDPVELVRSESGKLRAVLDTELYTGISAYNGTVNKQIADDAGINLFVYQGPIDDKNRDFCGDRVDQVFSREEIDKMDNEQELDVWVYKGGWNCRHEWIPVSLEYAQEFYGYKDNS